MWGASKKLFTVFFVCQIQVCDDVDECKGPNNGGCTANSICTNSVVRNWEIRELQRVEVGQLLYLCVLVAAVQRKPDVFIPAQGSYHCGSCKTGFTGDQVKGCKPEISCGNSLTNPCDINALCSVERDGSISCQVRLLNTHDTYIRNIRTSLSIFWRVCFVSLVWNRLGRKRLPVWKRHRHRWLPRWETEM